VILGIAWFVYTSTKEPVVETPSTTFTIQGSNNEKPESTDTSIRWEFGLVSEDPETGTPMREVSITYKGERRVVGTFPGSCSVVEDSSWPLLDNELTGVICWWAGGGAEVGVFYEDGKRVVKEGILEEGTAEEQGFRGAFEIAFSLD